MDYLPTQEEQDWLLDELANLIARRGNEPFLVMPIVLPTKRFFPDPWAFSHEGLDRVVRRLMQYAGLTDLDVRVLTFLESGTGPTEDSLPLCGKSTAATFLGIADGCCLFGFNERSPVNDEYMAGVMGHEVAHAYRAHFGLMETDLQREEMLTDLTSCFLGFGVLSANNSYRYRSAGAYGYHSWSVQRAGYLPSQAFAYLLGVQLVARRLSDGRARQTAKHLEANQAAFVRSALSAVRDRERDILGRLGVLGGQPTLERRLEDVLRPLPSYASCVVNSVRPADDEKGRRLVNRGRPVFRVRGMILEAVVYGSLAAILVGLAFGALFDSLLLGSVVMPLVLAGVIISRRYRRGRCSGPDCRAVLPMNADLCPDCGGTIAGSIGSTRDRWAAEEAYWAEHRNETAPSAPPFLEEQVEDSPGITDPEDEDRPS